MSKSALTTGAAAAERSDPLENASEFVRTRAGLRAKIIDGRALAKKVKGCIGVHHNNYVL